MYLAIVLVFAFLLFVFDIGSFPLISPDEPRYAETAREMIESNDFVNLFCNYLPRFDKPILFYWFEVLSFKVFGINEFAARFPSVLAGMGMVWLSYLIGNRHGFALVSSAITMTSFVFFLSSKLAITDMAVCFFISASLVFFYLGYCNRYERKQKFAFSGSISSKWFISSLIMMAFGFLTKGPIALLLPGLIILIFLIFVKDLMSFINHAKQELLLGFVSFLALTVPWFIAIHIKTQGGFTKEFFFNHNLNRFLHEHSGHGEPFWFFVPVLLVSLLPWSVFLLQSIFSFDYSRKYNLQTDKAVTQRIISFSLVWFAVIFVFFSFSQTKLVTYIMPGILPLNFIIAKWWHEKFKTNRSAGYENIDLMFGLGLYFILMASSVILAMTVFKSELAKIDTNAFMMPILIIGFIAIASTIIAMTAALHQAVISFNFLLASTVICYLVLSHFVFMPYAIFRDSGSKTFVQKLKAEDQLVTLKIHQTRFSFYGKRKVEKLGKKQLFNYLTSEAVMPSEDVIPGEAVIPSEARNLKRNLVKKYFVTKHRYIEGFERFIDKKASEFTNGSELFAVHEKTSRLVYAKKLDLLDN